MNEQDELGVRLAAAVNSALESRPFRSPGKAELVTLLRGLLKNTLSGQATPARKICGLIFGPPDRPPQEWDVADLDRARQSVFKLNRLLADYQKDLPTGTDRIVITKGEHLLEVAKEPTPSRTIDGIDVGEFGRLVRAICALNGIDAGERARRFKEWLNRPTLPPGPLAMARLLGLDFDDFVEKLHHGSVQITVGELREIAGLFDIHPLLLDPLLSEAVTTDHLVLDLERDFTDLGLQREPFRGKRAAYHIPRRRIAGTDAVFVKLVLEKEGESDIHEHPGDEVLLVRSGSVEVRFEQSGVRVRLEAGDIIHYYAEQRHGVVNLSREDSELFVVRVFQVEADGTRQAIMRDLQTALDKAKTTGHLHVSDHATAWIQQVVPRQYRPTNGGVEDALGLARFLERFGPPADGREPAARDAALSLRELSRAYGVPEFLLQNFSYPALSHVVVVRKDDFATLDSSMSAPGVTYQFPRKNLACSDISIAKVTIAADKSKDDLTDAPIDFANEHPGYETILVQQGSVVVYYDGTLDPVCEVTAQGSQICHFDSSRKHRLSNPSVTTDAVFFVIRFYRDGMRAKETI